jgi:hypothetical protein
MMRVRVFTDFCTDREIVERLERECESLLLPCYGLSSASVGRRARAGSSDSTASFSSSSSSASSSSSSPSPRRHRRRFVLTAGDDFTHAVVVNGARPDLGALPPCRALGLAQEPLPFLLWMMRSSSAPGGGDEVAVIEYVRRRLGRYLVGSTEYAPLPPPLQSAPGFAPPAAPLPAPFERAEHFVWYNAPRGAQPTLASKTHVLSFMVSAQTMAPGHAYRHALARRVLLGTRLPIHFFGSGCALLHATTGGALPRGHPLRCPRTGRDLRLRGSFRDCDTMLDRYLFHVCIENFAPALGADAGEYYSEKVIDPMVRETVPVYLGSPAVERAFPGSSVALSGNLETDVALLEAICLRPLDFLRRIDVAAVKRRCNFLYNLPRLFAEMMEQEERTNNH